MLNGHGDDLYRYKDIRVNFSSNVYNHFDHEGLFCYLADRLDNVCAYPEPTPKGLEVELSSIIGIGADNVCVTNGATEAIYLVAQTFRRSKSAILTPTFSEYADACRLHEHMVANIFDLDSIPEHAQIVWFCNPNNPTGTVIPKDKLLEIFGKWNETLFVLDASYAPFTSAELITPAEAAALPNVIMLHSMTKQYAIPGLRLGYITACEALLERIRLQRLPWAVNQVAIDAGHYLLMHPEEFEFDVKALMAERERVAKALESLGCIVVWPSDTHILLCRLRLGTAAALKDYLATTHGILIRDASNFDNLDPSFFRIAIQTEDENDMLVDAIGQWLAL